MLILFSILFITLMLLYTIIGGAFYITESIEDYENPDKKKLLCLLCGPFAWSFELMVTLFETISPFIDHLVYWFRH